MTLTIALCDACPSNEVDELTMSLLNIFDSRGLGFVLLEELIKHEVDNTGRLPFINRICVYAKCHRKRGRVTQKKLCHHEDAICLRTLERFIVFEIDVAKGSGAPHRHSSRP
jgi:hypothetical protein